MGERRCETVEDRYSNLNFRIFYECLKNTNGHYPTHTILPKKEIERIYPNRGEEFAG
jgi:hypothetical protein